MFSRLESCGALVLTGLLTVPWIAVGKAQEIELIDSISGRLVSDRDGSPIPGTDPTHAEAQLWGCFDENCFDSYFVNFQVADADGEFLFETDFNGERLLTGTYQIQAFANGFNSAASAPFDVAANSAVDLGDIVLRMLSLIGSVSGRVVDALSGKPLAGNARPFAFALVELCNGPGSCGWFGTSVDDQGRFLYTGPAFGLPPGVYRVGAEGDDYEIAFTEPMFIGEGDHVDVGDVAIVPFPIQFGDFQGCPLPPGGGLCKYSIQITNRGPKSLDGEAWSTIEYYYKFRELDPLYADFFPTHRNSRFQVGKAGAELPLPERINLGPGQSQRLSFQLFVPGNLPDASTICATATVGTNPHAHFNNQGDRFVFCAVTQAGNLQFMPEAEGRRHLLELKGDRR